MTAAWRALCTGAVLGLAVAAAASAQDKPQPKMKVLKPEADTYVTAAHPHRNFGRSSVLRVDASPRATAFLRFRHSSLRGKAESVTLLIHAQAVNRPRFEVRHVSWNDWEEDGLTHETAPRPSPQYAASKPVRSGAWSAVDVTPFVSGDDEAITLAITTRSRLGISFRSRESKHRPVLVVRRGGASGGDRPGGLPE